MAAIGVDKSRRSMLGRWSPDGSDDDVRMHRTVVRELVGKFVGPVAAGHSSETYDEGEIVAEVGKRLKERDMDWRTEGAAVSAPPVGSFSSGDGSASTSDAGVVEDDRHEPDE